MTDEEQKETMDRIVKLLEDGNTQRDAAVLAGISEATFYVWRKENKSFQSQCEAGILRFKQTLIDRVKLDATGDGKLALEVLARRWPEDWAGRLKVELTPPEEKVKKVMEIIEGKYDNTNKVPGNSPDLLQGQTGKPVSTDE